MSSEAPPDHDPRLLQLQASLEEQRRERQRAEAEARQFVALVEHSSDFVGMAGLDGRVQFINAAGRRLLGLAPEADVTQLALGDMHTAQGLERAAILRQQGRWQGEGQLRHLPTGELIPTQVSSFLIRDGAGQPLGYATVQRDLRAWRQLEEQLRHVQKMEAVGRLASGVAHDFNNLLFVVLNYARVLAAQLPEGSPHASHVQEIQKAAERGVGLTRQLLAFSRMQVTEPQPVDLGQIVSDMENMIRGALGPGNTLEIERGAGLRRVRADVGQMEQVLLNLAVNARDAMPRGGRLTLATANVEVGEALAAELGCARGPYVRLSVRDTGTGIDPAIRSRIFDPFFTTKPPGQGTGLGLSIVFGVVKQSGGALAVSSPPGQGATFDVYLPAADAPPAG
jgi:PAS domain S-box-containing protein